MIVFSLPQERFRASLEKSGLHCSTSWDMEDFSLGNKLFHPALDIDIGKEVMVIELLSEINTFVL